MKKFILSFLAGLLFVSASLGQGFFFKSFKFETEYKNVINYARANAAMLPDGFTRIEGNKLMIAAKSNGVLSGADQLLILSSTSRDFAKLDWKNPSGSNNATEVGTLTFSTLGFKGDASTGTLNTNFNPATEASNFTQNSGSVGVHVTSFDAQANTNIFGLRNLAGTSQIAATIRSASVPNATRGIINSNTNTDLASSGYSRGFYSFQRPASNNQVILRGQESGNSAVTSVSIPSGDIHLFGRNSLSTSAIDARTDASLGYFRIGNILSTDDRTRWLNALTDYFHAIQKPYVYATAARNNGVVVSPLFEISSNPSDWDSGSIFGAAFYKNGGTHFILYGGTQDSGDGPIGYSAGAWDFSGRLTGSKDMSDHGESANGIIIDIADYPTLESILPMDCLIIGTDVYWFFTVRLDDGNETHDTWIAHSTTSDPKNIGTLTALITAGGTGHYNHGFKIVHNHPDATYWYATYAFRNTSSSAFQINTIRCLRSADITNGANWSVVDTDIKADPPNVVAGSNILQNLYPFAWYNSTSSKYHLLNGRFNDEKRQGFTIVWAESSTLNNFPMGLEVVWPSGSLSPTSPDTGYTSLPYIDFDENLLYYAGRRGTGSASYISVNVREVYLRD